MTRFLLALVLLVATSFAQNGEGYYPGNTTSEPITVNVMDWAGRDMFVTLQPGEWVYEVWECYTTDGQFVSWVGIAPPGSHPEDDAATLWSTWSAYVAGWEAYYDELEPPIPSQEWEDVVEMGYL